MFKRPSLGLGTKLGAATLGGAKKSDLDVRQFLMFFKAISIKWPTYLPNYSKGQ